MALLSAVAGRYSATYDPPGVGAAADMGVTEDGWEIGVKVAKEVINESDEFGGMVAEAIYRGLADCTLTATGLEYIQGLLNAALPYSQVTISGATFLGPGLVGRLDSDVAGAVILTSTASTPAAAKPATATATLAVWHESMEAVIRMNSKLRKLPGKWRIMPWDDAGTVKLIVFT